MSDKVYTKTEKGPMTQEEIDEAQQEQYYWHVLMEFHAILKIFGNAKVLADLKKIKEEVEGVKEEPRIITL